ncbi:hypothetical protein U9M48_032090, partial [Paspalum notatum var. saurae]
LCPRPCPRPIADDLRPGAPRALARADILGSPTPPAPLNRRDVRSRSPHRPRARDPRACFPICALPPPTPPTRVPGSASHPHPRPPLLYPATPPSRRPCRRHRPWPRHLRRFVARPPSPSRRPWPGWAAVRPPLSSRQPPARGLPSPGRLQRRVARVPGTGRSPGTLSEKMDPMKNNGGRTPFKDLTNTTSWGDQDASNSLPQDIDPKERKRQRDRERWATMSAEQNIEKNKRRREARQQNKGQPILPELSKDGDVEGDDEWLHRNETYEPYNVERGDLALAADSTSSYGDNSNTIQFTNLSTNPMADTPLGRRQRGTIEEDNESSNKTLHHESIAMENPKYIPEVVQPTTGVYAPLGSPVSSSDWIVPNLSPSPTFIVPVSRKHEDVDTSERSPRCIRQKRNVPSGKRQSLLARRNQQFESAIARRVYAIPKDDESDAGEKGNSTQPQTTADINNNEHSNPCPSPTVATSNGKDRQGDGEEHPQTMLEFISSADGHDDAVIFEEDDEDDEGYLFAGQEEDIDEENDVEETQDESSSIPDVPDLYDKVYSNMPEETHMLRPVPNCKHCNAKKFEYERPGFCCRNGDIDIAPQTTCGDLMRLWSSADADAREASSEHKHLVLYFYDDDSSLEHRYRRCREEKLEKDKQLINQLASILRGNLYSERLRIMGHVKNLDDYHIELNLDQTLDQRTYNTPLTS